MPPAARHSQIDELIRKAAASLTPTACFEAERMALKGLMMAREVEDYARMVECIAPLKAARLQRLDLALRVRKVAIFQGPVSDNGRVESGCYLVEPPLVGADARRFRLAALQTEVPVAVLCREPMTKLKQWPIVTIGAGITLRTRIAPPRNPASPDVPWFTGALASLGDWAITTIDPAIDLHRRIDVLLERLDTIPEHEKLHDALAEACGEATGRRRSPPERSGSRLGMKS